ncbi:spore germination protein, GerA family [Desulfitobacterium dichloroeliminans LMG P-21439]|uniref:Spore germination protein, GerA family n=1 Tax=Desulfitobacterium dichloroeliminans (strain LMG P-21439 / DCA1) TaxID=871963 RepID=L0F552_DESDL|nr:spore germination protein [Desulfitobacterium dichloroeliminans]AGA68160.1 spore germination protein, GerA family [Desulfitobacterium dichloroeliminans LMG P-21439]
MFWKKRKSGSDRKQNDPNKEVENTTLTLDTLKNIVVNMDDAEIIERQINPDHKVTLLYIRTLINQERLNDEIIEPLIHHSPAPIHECINVCKASKVNDLDEAQRQLMEGAILLRDRSEDQWLAIKLENPLSRSIESSETETILFGPKDSFSEQIEQNVTLIRRRLPLTTLKTEKFTVGSLTKTPIVLMYIEGLTNPELITIAKSKILTIDYDLFLDSSQVAAFMEDHVHSIFPQFQQTDRPDSCVYALGAGKLTILVGNTPFALIAPITFFDLFISPDDYIHRWLIGSFLRGVRFVSFFLSLTMIPLYVALNTHHYQMFPLQVLFVLLESRSKLPFTPFWEAFLMLIIIEIIIEASLRMPTKTGQTLGVIGGIVIGQASVEAGFASKVLIVTVGISTIASFLVPNYLMVKANRLLLFAFMLLSSILGIFGMALGFIIVLVHLNGLTSLKQPYFAPIAPLHMSDWKDLFIRAPLQWIKTRPVSLYPRQKWRSSRRR